MINIAIDNFDPVTGRPMPNGISADQLHLVEQMDGHRLDYPRLYYYLSQCNIPVQLVRPDTAPANSWYLMVLGWFDFSADYLAMISPDALKRILAKEMKVVFTYHEGDNPAKIRQRLEELCTQHNIDSSLVWLVSGNSAADKIDNCLYWPELEFMYWRTVDLNSGAPFHTNPRTHQFTALCRIDKLWRKVFMSELWAKGLHTQGYFSYNQVYLGGEDDYYGCALRNSYLADKQAQVDAFIAAGPFKADSLDSVAHNDYAANMNEFYSNSYFNVVLETMIDIDNSGGVFVTEKTFKPIFNNQFFVEVNGAHSLAHLRELGYKTFSRCIDESYDAIDNNQERFEAVLDLTQSLIKQDLHDIYQALAPEIQHNSELFRLGMAQRLRKLAAYLNSVA